MSWERRGSRRRERQERQEGPTGRVLAELVTDGADFGV